MSLSHIAVLLRLCYIWGKLVSGKFPISASAASAAADDEEEDNDDDDGDDCGFLHLGFGGGSYEIWNSDCSEPLALARD